MGKHSSDAGLFFTLGGKVSVELKLFKSSLSCLERKGTPHCCPSILGGITEEIPAEGFFGLGALPSLNLMRPCSMHTKNIWCFISSFLGLGGLKQAVVFPCV